MKAAFSAFLCIFLAFFPAMAFTEDRLPVACDSTKKVLEQIKKKQFELVLMGEVDQVQTMIFINPENDMVVAVVVQVEQKSTTCIFIAGEKNTTLFNFPKKDKDKDL